MYCTNEDIGLKSLWRITSNVYGVLSRREPPDGINVPWSGKDSTRLSITTTSTSIKQAVCFCLSHTHTHTHTHWKQELLLFTKMSSWEKWGGLSSLAEATHMTHKEGELRHTGLDRRLLLMQNSHRVVLLFLAEHWLVLSNVFFFPGKLRPHVVWIWKSNSCIWRSCVVVHVVLSEKDTEENQSGKNNILLIIDASCRQHQNSLSRLKSGGLRVRC
jgi:hypothetical protein